MYINNKVKCLISTTIIHIHAEVRYVMGLSFIEEVALPSPKSSPPIADQLLSHRVVLLEEQLLQDALASLVFFQARLELVHADILPERRF